MAQLFYLETDETGFPKEYFSTSSIISIEHLDDDESEQFSIIRLNNQKNIVVKHGATSTAKTITSEEPIVRFESGNPKFKHDDLGFILV